MSKRNKVSVEDSDDNRTSINDQASDDDRASIDDQVSDDDRASINDQASDDDRSSINDQASDDDRASINDQASDDYQTSFNSVKDLQSPTPSNPRISFLNSHSINQSSFKEHPTSRQLPITKPHGGLAKNIRKVLDLTKDEYQGYRVSLHFIMFFN
jgi:hypothetical protein